MLMKNSVTLQDSRSEEFDDLQYLLRPVPNRKFLFTNLRTAVYVNSKPKIKKNGTVKEGWLKRKIGEPPVLLDTSQIDYSVNQLQLQLRKLGYFSPEIQTEIQHKRANPKKVTVNYRVKVNNPHFVRAVNYTISQPEFRRIILLDTANSLLKPDMQYNESLIIEERNRIADHIRDQGYYYVNNNLILIEVDTLDASLHLNNLGMKTLSLNIIVDPSHVRSEAIRERMLYKYEFDKVYIHTNYDLATTQDEALDTVKFYSYRDKSDSTVYYFITPKFISKKGKSKIYKDFKYRTITDNIFTKRGDSYTHFSYNKSYTRLRGLENFSIINIEFFDNRSALDSVFRTGRLDVQYKLTRSKLNSVALEGSARNDKLNLSFSYTNKNLFKGAEYFTINLYAGWYYYNLFSSDRNTQEAYKNYFDIGVNTSLSYPRLLFLKNIQKSNAIKYSTAIRLGVNYNDLYKRLKINVAATYSWNPKFNIAHSISPININTYDTSRRVGTAIENYPSDYRQRFSKSMDISIPYLFNYTAPIRNKNHNFRMSLEAKSSGLLIYGMEELFREKGGERWTFFDYQYTKYESGFLSLRYFYTINKKNSIAMRFNAGAAFSYGRKEDQYLPFESGFSVGGANSIRGWGYRLLGPGGFNTDVYMERTGDIVLEYSLEYRGSIWKAFKYGIFLDVGNIWMRKEYPEMDAVAESFSEKYRNEAVEVKKDPLLTSQFTKDFYKQLAVSAGLGIRLDFNFFLIRIDYGIPIYDPSAPIYIGKTINSQWFKKTEMTGKYWNFWQGFQIAIGHAIN